MLGGERYIAGSTREQSHDWLEQAKRNLEYCFAYFGILEDYARSKDVFCRTFGLPGHYAQGEERCNTSPFAEARAKPDDTTLDLLRRENSLDVELYRFALELFERRWSALHRLPADPLYSPLRIWPHPYVQDGGFSLSATEIKGSGLHRPDDSPNGASHIWTGRLPRATLDLAVNLPRRGAVEIRLYTVANVGPLEQLRVRLDGIPPTSLDIEFHADHQQIVCRFHLQTEICTRAVHALEIEGPLRIPVNAAGQPTDSRRLGVALRRIDVSWQRWGVAERVRRVFQRRAA
jgi:hypothetical protein